MASMILPDVNLLIYAHNEFDERFQAADRWFNDLLSGASQFCVSWETINGFIRLSTSARIIREPLELSEAFATVRYWLDTANAILLDKTPRHLRLLEQVATASDASGPRFSDAVLATIAIEHNATLATTDSDFQRFDGLQVINPLEAR